MRVARHCKGAGRVRVGKGDDGVRPATGGRATGAGRLLLTKQTRHHTRAGAQTRPSLHPMHWQVLDQEITGIRSI